MTRTHTTAIQQPRQPMSDRAIQVQPDDWLSLLLKRRVYRLVVDTACPALMERIREEAQGLRQALQQKPVFMYTKVVPKETRLIEFLEVKGFHLIDTNLLFSKPVVRRASTDQPIAIRFARPEDEEEAVSLARSSFTYSRFHLDPCFPNETANAIKGEWVRGYFKSTRGQALLVAEVNKRIAGFLLLLCNEADRAITIDLVATDREHRRKGIAQGMVRFAETHMPDYKTIMVGTQLANMPSVTLYTDLGFSMVSASYVFHYHG